jgi:hypothetical protein
MADVQYPLINGVFHEWSSVEFKIKGKVYRRVKSINYQEELKPTKVYGTSADPIGRTRGMREAEGDVEVYLDEFRQIVADVGAGFGELVFDVTVSYSETAVSTVTDHLIGCRFEQVGASQSQSADALTRKLKLSTLSIKWNGVDLLKKPLSGAA